MSANWEDKLVKCPFYRSSHPGRIVCEGVQEGCTINLAFQDRGAKMRYMKSCCESFEGLRECRIHNLLEEMYEDE